MMYTSSEREEDQKKTDQYAFVKGYLVKGSFSSEDIQAAIDEVAA